MTQLYPFCIYTTVATQRLEAVTDGSGELIESRLWKTGWDLFQKARAVGQEMPILFSEAASNCSALVNWAIITDIRLDENRTKCCFHKLQRLPDGKHATQELRLRSTNREIAPGFIRPYAICHTPEFLGAISEANPT